MKNHQQPDWAPTCLKPWQVIWLNGCCNRRPQLSAVGEWILAEVRGFTFLTKFVDDSLLISATTENGKHWQPISNRLIRVPETIKMPTIIHDSRQPLCKAKTTWCPMGGIFANQDYELKCTVETGVFSATRIRPLITNDGDRRTLTKATCFPVWRIQHSRVGFWSLSLPKLTDNHAT